MEVKIRRVSPEIIIFLDARSKENSISREELIRMILKQYVEDERLKENPLKETLRKNEELLEDVKTLLIKIGSQMELR